MCSIFPWVLDDETLTSFIKQSTQQKGKGRTKREEPMFMLNVELQKWGPLISHLESLPYTE